MRCFITVPAHLDRLITAIATDEHRSSKQQLEHWICQAAEQALKERTLLQEHVRPEVAHAQAP